MDLPAAAEQLSGPLVQASVFSDHKEPSDADTDPPGR